MKRETLITTSSSTRKKELIVVTSICFIAVCIWTICIGYLYSNRDILAIALAFGFIFSTILFITQTSLLIRLLRNKYIPSLDYNESMHGYTPDYIPFLLERRLLIRYIESIQFKEINNREIEIEVRSSLSNQRLVLYNFTIILTKEGFLNLKDELYLHGIPDEYFTRKK